MYRKVLGYQVSVQNEVCYWGGCGVHARARGAYPAGRVSGRLLGAAHLLVLVQCALTPGPHPQAGRVTGDTKVWTAGMGDWERIRFIKHNYLDIEAALEHKKPVRMLTFRDWRV